MRSDYSIYFTYKLTIIRKAKLIVRWGRKTVDPPEADSRVALDNRNSVFFKISIQDCIEEANKKTMLPARDISVCYAIFRARINQ